MHSANLSKNTINARFKRQESHQMTEHSMSFLSFKMSVSCVFSTDWLTTYAPLLFLASSDVSNELQLSGLHRSS